ncbi:type II secretion system F family protein [Candidatus Woesearchaeota archaeon]|nr:type II secretion system F family protein [Nanoarchaeota archaeon]MCB9370808.1 type II secretion system F family protein [Candidatus Woesearchaeota archaeon]USN43908.1 MAG: type II secretion system F family protein [Candidatus Woesearchaeota archaeon]
MFTVFLGILLFAFFKDDIGILFLAYPALLCATPLIFKFCFTFIDVWVVKEARALEGDLLFVSEFFLVSLESGLPLGNSIQRLSTVKRPGGRFFYRLYADFKTGKDLEQAITDAAGYSASDNLKILLKRLKDSLDVGVDLKEVLENFIDEMSEKKIIEIRAYSKRLNPIVMMYLLLGIVLPSLGVTFFILGASMLNVTSGFLQLILLGIFLFMLLFQYMAFGLFRFSRSTV